jgi:hypothetical protein
MLFSATSILAYSSFEHTMLLGKLMREISLDVGSQFLVEDLIDAFLDVF